MTPLLLFGGKRNDVCDKNEREEGVEKEGMGEGKGKRERGEEEGEG